MVYKIGEVPLVIIFQYGLVEIFKDRIKMGKGLIARGIKKEPTDNLNSLFVYFIDKNSISFEDFKSCYHFPNFKNGLFNCKEEGKKDLFEILIEKKQLQKLKYIYQDEKFNIEQEKIYYEKLKKDRFEEIKKNYQQNEFNLEIIPDHKEYKSPFSIHFNTSLLKNAIQFSSLEIVKFLIEEVKIDYQYHSHIIYYWCLLSNNRNILIEYFMEIVKLPIPKVYNGTISHSSFFSNILNLKFSIFKKLVKAGSPIFYNYTQQLYVSFLDYKLTIENKSLLNKIQILLYCFYLDSDSSSENKLDYLIYIKIIKHLIKYNNNQIYENRLTINIIQNIIIKLNKKYNHTNNNNNDNNNSNNNNNNNNESTSSNEKSFYELFSWFFKNNNNNNNNIECNNTSISKVPKIKESILNYYYRIDFNKFNLEKEIKRILIFDSPQKLSNLSIYRTELLVYYSCKFKEYSIVNEYINELKSNAEPNSLKKLLKGTIKIIYESIVFYRDIDFYIYCRKNNIINESNLKQLNHYIFPNYFHNPKYKINQSPQNNVHNINDLDFQSFQNETFQYCYKQLELFSKYNDPFFISLLINLLNTNKFTIDDIPTIMSLLKEYYKKNPSAPLIEANKLKPNNKIILYIYDNYRNLIDWPENFIFRI